MSTYYPYHMQVIGESVRVSAYVPESQEPDYPEGRFRLGDCLEQVEKLVAKVHRGTSNEIAHLELGELLYESLFDSGLDVDFRERLSKHNLRIELELDDENSPGIAALPWEFLRAPEEQRHPGFNLSTHPNIVLVRHRQLWNASQQIDLDQKLRILVMVAAPDDLGPVEYEAVLDTIQRLATQYPDRIDDPQLLTMVQLQDFDTELANSKPHILHFIGHGRQKKYRENYWGELALLNSDKRTAKWIKDITVAELFQRHRPSIAFFQACDSGKQSRKASFSGVASKVAHENIPFVVAMQFPVNNAAAVRFADTFYTELCEHKQVALAVQEGRRDLGLEFPGQCVPMTPIVFSRVRPSRTEETKNNDNSELIYFSDSLINDYPYPIAVACHEFNQAEDPTARFLRLDMVLTNSVKFLAIIALTHFRKNPSVDRSDLKDLLTVLARPNLESWCKILGSILERFMFQESSPELDLLKPYHTLLFSDSLLVQAELALNELSGNKSSDRHTPQTFIETLVRYRKNLWATNPSLLPHSQQQQLIRILVPALEQFWEIFASLADCSLRYIVRVDQEDTDWIYELREFKGYRDLPNSVAPFTESGDTANYRSGQVILFSESVTPLISLHPFLACIDYRLYFLDYNDQNQIVRYTPCGAGKDFVPPAYFRSFMLSAFDQTNEDPNPILDEAIIEIGNSGHQNDSSNQTSNELLMKLIKRLSDEGYAAIEMAIGESLRIGRFWVGIETLLMSLSRQQDSAFSNFLKMLNLRSDEFRGFMRGQLGVATRDRWRNLDIREIGRQNIPRLECVDPQTLALDYDPRASLSPLITPRFLSVLQEAAELAGDGSIDHIHLLSASLKQVRSAAVSSFFGYVYQRSQLRIEEILARVNAMKDEVDASPPNIDEKQQGYDPPAPPSVGQQSADSILTKYGIDLVAKAKSGKIHHAIGVDHLLRRIKRTLIQREINNPLLIGEPGVGKTAIVESLAWELAYDEIDVPTLSGKRIIQLSINDLIAGATYRGELEDRLKVLVDEIEASSDTIVFIDEIHTLLADNTQKTIVDTLKPSLARGEFICIGATTISEYQRYIENDRSLSRRFETILVEEPTEEHCYEILEGIRETLETHYEVRIRESALKAAISLSKRYIPSEHLPAKAIKLLEQAGAYVKFPSFKPTDDETSTPIFTEVDERLIRYIVTQKTGIPLEVSVSNTQDIDIEAKLRERIVGQHEAIQSVAGVIRRSRARLTPSNRPLGVFLFVGPSGVGKTELARSLADALFGADEHLNRFDMSEYSESHQLARLIGSPPGYKGYDDGGQLTNILKLQPFSVILFDEIEKAHPDVHNTLLGLFDVGRLTDGKGNTIDGRESIFIMTSNVGSEEYSRVSTGFLTDYQLDPNWLAEKKQDVEKSLKNVFSPEFLNRIDHIIHFTPLSFEEIKRIFDLQFEPIRQSLRNNHKVDLDISIKAAEYICKRGYDPLNGARPLVRAIDQLIAQPLSEWILNGTVATNERVTIDYDDERLVFEKSLRLGGDKH